MPHRLNEHKEPDKVMQYKIGLRGKPYFLDEVGEWRLSRKTVSEVKRIIDQQNRGKRGDLS